MRIRSPVVIKTTEMGRYTVFNSLSHHCMAPRMAPCSSCDGYDVVSLYWSPSIADLQYRKGTKPATRIAEPIVKMMVKVLSFPGMVGVFPVFLLKYVSEFGFCGVFVLWSCLVGGLRQLSWVFGVAFGG